MNKQALSALVIGFLFGFGLALAGMLNPAKVQGFLDITRIWDPSLSLCYGGWYWCCRYWFSDCEKRGAPVLAQSFSLPELVKLDRPLLVGAGLFGIGWGAWRPMPGTCHCCPFTCLLASYYFCCLYGARSCNRRKTKGLILAKVCC